MYAIFLSEIALLFPIRAHIHVLLYYNGLPKPLWHSGTMLSSFAFPTPNNRYGHTQPMPLCHAFTPVVHLLWTYKCTSNMIFALQLWARVYRDDRYHAAVDTNNGVEAMNKTLKYNYLPKGKNITLSHLVTILVEEFLPEMLQKYQKENFAMSESYRSYNEFVPEYLKGRPRSVVLHCLSRIRKAERFTKESVEQIDKSSQFTVKSASGKEHTLKFTNDENMPECTCKDWTRWYIPCKHFFAVFNQLGMDKPTQAVP